jgi:integrase
MHGEDPLKGKRIGDRLRAAIRERHYSLKTEKSYLMWYLQYVRFHEMRHPGEMGEREVGEFLRHLAADRGVAAGTHAQALNALVFLYRHVLGTELKEADQMRPRRPKRLPVVLSIEEVRGVLSAMSGVEALVARLLYGCGLRISEALRLRVKDLDLGQGEMGD